jgi:WD40 repeat protein
MSDPIVNLNLQRVSQWKMTQPITSLAFQHQTLHVFTGDVSGNISCYDIYSGDRLVVLEWHNSPVMAMVFAGDYLYSFDRLQNLVCWDVQTCQIERIHSLSIPAWMPERLRASAPHPATVAMAMFTATGDRLIYGVDSHPDSFTSGCSSLYLIDIKTASIVGEFNSDRFFANLDVSSIDKIAISGDDRQLIASGLDIIYDSIGDWSYCREFIYQWCLDDGAEICTYEYNNYLYGPSNHRLIDIVFSPDDRQIFSAADGELYSWQVPPATSRELTIADDEAKLEFSSYEGIFDLSPNFANLIAFGSSNGYLRFIDLVESETIFEQRISQSKIEHLRFSHTGEFLAVCTKNLIVEVWQVFG